MMKAGSLFATLPLAMALAGQVSAQSETKVDVSFNQVAVGESRGRKKVQTGNESRTQLSNDAGTIRLGSNSDASIRTSGDVVDLRAGVMMVNTNKKGLIGRKEMTVETDQIRATSNASMLISYQPKRYVKIACLEGKVSVSLKGLASERVTIRKGQMLIVNCLENVLPAAVSVDMSRLMQTSPLLAPALRGGAALAAAGARGAGGRNPNNGGNPQGQQAPPPQPGAQAPPSPPPRGLAGAGPPIGGRRPLPNNLPVRRFEPPAPGGAPAPIPPGPMSPPPPPPPPPPP